MKSYRLDGASWLPALVVGALCVVLFVLGFLGRASDLSSGMDSILHADRLIRFSSVFRGSLHNALPVTLIDIDNTTFDAWKQPALTPRDKLRDLIARAAGLGASAVIVDIDLSYQADPQQTQALQDYLKKYDGPPLILVRPVITGRDGQALRFKTSAFDAIVAANDRISFGSARFKFESDLIVRRWILWEFLCSRDANGGDAILSAELQTAFLLRKGAPAPERLRQMILRQRPSLCGNPEAGAQLDRRGYLLPFYDFQRSRMTFYFGDHFATDDNGASDVPPPVQIAHDIKGDLNGRAVPLLYKIRAGYLLGDNAVSADLFKDRVVIIGSTHRETRDLYMTPFDLMHGSVILANAVVGAADSLGEVVIGHPFDQLASVLLFLIFLTIFIYLRPMLAVIICLFLALGGVYVGQAELNIFNAVDIMGSALALIIVYQLLLFFVVQLPSDFFQHGLRAILATPNKARNGDAAGAQAQNRSLPPQTD